MGIRIAVVHFRKPLEKVEWVNFKHIKRCTLPHVDPVVQNHNHAFVARCNALQHLVRDIWRVVSAHHSLLDDAVIGVDDLGAFLSVAPFPLRAYVDLEVLLHFRQETGETSSTAKCTQDRVKGLILT